MGRKIQGKAPSQRPEPLPDATEEEKLAYRFHEVIYAFMITYERTLGETSDLFEMNAGVLRDAYRYERNRLPAVMMLRKMHLANQEMIKSGQAEGDTLPFNHRYIIEGGHINEPGDIDKDAQIKVVSEDTKRQLNDIYELLNSMKEQGDF